MLSRPGSRQGGGSTIHPKWLVGQNDVPLISPIVCWFSNSLQVFSGVMVFHGFYMFQCKKSGRPWTLPLLQRLSCSKHFKTIIYIHINIYIYISTYSINIYQLHSCNYIPNWSSPFWSSLPTATPAPRRCHTSRRMRTWPFPRRSSDCWVPTTCESTRLGRAWEAAKAWTTFYGEHWRSQQKGGVNMMFNIV